MPKGGRERELQISGVDKKKVQIVFDGSDEICHGCAPSRIVMKTNRTILLSSQARFERCGEILGFGVGGCMTLTHPRKDWSLPKRRNSEQDGLTSA